MTAAGPYLGVDVGDVRIGVALSDPDGILATPLLTLRRGNGDLAQLAKLVKKHRVGAVVVGLPVSLSGAKGRAAVAVEQYAGRLAARIAPVSVHLADERLTTVVASRVLSERGVRGRRARAVVDQIAAVEILQGWLDARRARPAVDGGADAPDREASS